ncbi:hypothetical protein [uncultured Rothia sp.]|uniref:hypothetical protein n=1 Tax=uncultured Rothia sp. TaxID=316088 RepID=UPI0032170FA4
MWGISTHREVKRGFALVERLRYDPWSVWRAEQLGGEEHIGWSVDSYLLAAAVDGIHSQLKSKKLSSSERVERPKVEKKREKFDPNAPVASMNLKSLLPEGW